MEIEAARAVVEYTYILSARFAYRRFIGDANRKMSKPIRVHSIRTTTQRAVGRDRGFGYERLPQARHRPTYFAGGRAGMTTPRAVVDYLRDIDEQA